MNTRVFFWKVEKVVGQRRCMIFQAIVVLSANVLICCESRENALEDSAATACILCDTLGFTAHRRTKWCAQSLALASLRSDAMVHGSCEEAARTREWRPYGRATR